MYEIFLGASIYSLIAIQKQGSPCQPTLPSHCWYTLHTGAGETMMSTIPTIPSTFEGQKSVDQANPIDFTK